MFQVHLQANELWLCLHQNVLAQVPLSSSSAETARIPVSVLFLMSRSQLAVLGDMTSMYSSSLRMLLMMEGFCTCECTSTSWFVCRGHKVWAKPTPQELLPSSWVKKWTRCSCTRSCTSLFPKVSNSWELNGQLWKSNSVIRENGFSVKLLNLFYR